MQICCSHLEAGAFPASAVPRAFLQHPDSPRGAARQPSSLPAIPGCTEGCREGRKAGSPSPSPSHAARAAFSEISITPGYQKNKSSPKVPIPGLHVHSPLAPLSPTIDLCLIKPWQRLSRGGNSADSATRGFLCISFCFAFPLTYFSLCNKGLSV